MSTLYLMCGIPGSGKSTLVKNLPISIMQKGRINIVESDEERKRLLDHYGFPNAIHQNTISDELLPVNKKKKIENEVWARVENVVKETLVNDDIVIDATNTEQKVLKNWFHFASQHRHKVKVIVMTTPLDVCIERNNERESPVPDDVMNYMYNSYIQTIGWLYLEHQEKIINSAHL